ncbi:MAG: hypothetical protein QOF62_101 [Pyrinomonadaceae bacterium]|jgi:hypothetical protein|nr:hypothetical protein [Pyrinomonadaceae bacterium]
MNPLPVLYSPTTTMEDWGPQTLSGRLLSEMNSRVKVLAVVEGI